MYQIRSVQIYERRQENRRNPANGGPFLPDDLWCILHITSKQRIIFLITLTFLYHKQSMLVVLTVYEKCSAGDIISASVKAANIYLFKLSIRNTIKMCWNRFKVGLFLLILLLTWRGKYLLGSSMIMTNYTHSKDVFHKWL